jgi:hypothetical protein
MKELIPISIFIGFFALMFAIRYFSNKEKMAMIERGMDPGSFKPAKTAPLTFWSLKIGLLLIGCGVGLLVAIFTVRGVFGTVSNENEGQAVAIYFGSIGIFGGLGLVISYLFEKSWLDKQ